ncbi:MAG TPA: FUSC family membrane protein, partial [Rhodocyclaceae bacterium]
MDHQRHLHTHYFYSGLTVAAGVAGICLVGYLLGGVPLAAAMAMGAFCVSINDVPTPDRHKLLEISSALLLGTLVTISVGLARAHTLGLGAAILGVSFVAAMITAWGRKTLPLSFSMFFAMVLTLAVPLPDPAEAQRHSLLFFAGGAAYLVYAVTVARSLSFRTRQQALGECIAELAGFLRDQAAFFDPAQDFDACQRALIRRQVALADKMQTARDLVFRKLRTERDGMLASALIALLELFEHLLSGHTDYTALRRRYRDEDLLLFFRDLCLKGGQDLEQIALALMRDQLPQATVNYKAELFAIEHEMGRLRRDAGSEGSQSLLMGVYDRILHLLDQIEHLRRAAATPMPPEQALRGVAVEHFLSHTSYSLHLLLANFTLSSPIFRYALRMLLAMACGYWVDLVVPYTAHGYWILLTIAVIMRSSFSMTRQRQRDRILGNLIGCLLAVFLLWATSNPLVLMAVAFCAVGVSHAYVNVNFRYAAVASCLMGLLPTHFLDPGSQFLAAERLLDTGVGALIAWLFSFVLPSWEATAAPRHVRELLHAADTYTRATLDPSMTPLGYRLARKQMIDASATLGGSLLRMLDEPQHQRGAERALNELVSAAYRLAAQLASVHILLQMRGAELDLPAAQACMAATAGRIAGLLDGNLGAAPPCGVASGDSSAQAVLRRRLEAIETEAREM